MVNLNNTLFSLSQQMRMAEVQRQQQEQQQAMAVMADAQAQIESKKDREFDRKMRMAELQGKYAQMAGEPAPQSRNRKIMEALGLGGMGARAEQSMQDRATKERRRAAGMQFDRDMTKTTILEDEKWRRLKAQLDAQKRMQREATRRGGGGDWQKRIDWFRKPLKRMSEKWLKAGNVEIAYDKAGRPILAGLGGMDTQEAEAFAEKALLLERFLATPAADDIGTVLRLREALRGAQTPDEVRAAIRSVERPLGASAPATEQLTGPPMPPAEKFIGPPMPPAAADEPITRSRDDGIQAIQGSF